MKIKLFCCFFLFVSFSVRGQVTIGTKDLPSNGSLLDLKQHKPDSDNVTSNKGLGFPRVNLESQNHLYPMYSEDVTNYLANKEELDKAHTGLLVYNLKDLRTSIVIPPSDCDPATIVKDGTLTIGLAIWNGEKWENLLEQPDDNNSNDNELANNVFLLYDHEDNEYTYSKFGDAGYWMTTSLITKTPPPSIESPLTYSLWNSPLGVSQNASLARYGYPRKTAASIQDDVDFIGNENVGLLYSKGAASGGKAITIPMQGMCPDGWHIPTNIEYEELLTEIMDNLSVYTVDGNASTTRSQAITTSCNRFGPAQGAVSKPAYSGGFSFIMSGFGSASKGEVENNALFEIACVNNGQLGFVAGGFDSATVPSYLNLRYADWTNIQMLTIRCKKND